MSKTAIDKDCDSENFSPKTIDGDEQKLSATNSNKKINEDHSLFIHFLEKVHSEVNRTTLDDITNKNSDKDSNSKILKTTCTQDLNKNSQKKLSKNDNGSMSNSSNELSFIDDLIKQIVKSCNTNPENLKDKLGMLLAHCCHAEVPLYLVKRKFLHIMINILHTKKIMIVTTLRIFTGFFDNEVLELISNDKDYVIKLLESVEFSNKLALLELLKFLQIKIIRNIQQNSQSNWIFRLKQFENLEKFTITLFTTVDNCESIYYDLIRALIKLLQSMSETKVSFGMNLLGYLFDLNKLVHVLLMFCARLVKKKKSDLKGKIDETDFISHWLSLMNNILKCERYTYQNFNDEHYVLFDIICKILKSYEQSDISSLILNIEHRDVDVICRCMNILLHFHSQDKTPLPSPLVKFLMNITFRLATDLDSRKKDTYREKILYKLLLNMKTYWLWIVEHGDDLIISDLIKTCRAEVRKYLTNLVVSNGSRMAEEKLKKLQKRKNAKTQK